MIEQPPVKLGYRQHAMAPNGSTHPICLMFNEFRKDFSSFIQPLGFHPINLLLPSNTVFFHVHKIKNSMYEKTVHTILNNQITLI